jgi:hypothetical protein
MAEKMAVQQEGVVFIKDLISFVCFLNAEGEEMDGYKKCPQRPLQIHLTGTREGEHSTSFIVSVFYGYVLLSKTGGRRRGSDVYKFARDAPQKTTFRFLHFSCVFMHKMNRLYGNHVVPLYLQNC